MAEDFITLTFPDGNQESFPKNSTGYDVASHISKGLARNALSITLGDEIRDLDRPIERSDDITINTWDSDDGQYTFWYSSAHLLAEAVQDLYPEAKFGIGPPIDDGFYYDIDFGDKTVGLDDLPEIEEKMIELARNKSEFKRREVSKEDALLFYKKKGNEYKVDLIEIWKTEQSLFTSREI